MRADLFLHSRALRLALSPLLAPASLVYAAALACDRARKSASRTRLPVPTISVGNLTVGGTGKTPVLLRLLGDLLEAGRRPAVLTRGYAGAGKRAGAGILVPGGDPSAFSDEVRLLALKFPSVPVAVGADRASRARFLLEGDAPDVFALDDGFQHWALERDLDAVCLDATRPGERFLLPLGRLREPLGALARAGVVLLTRCELAKEEDVAALERAARRHARGPVLRTAFDLRLVDVSSGAPATGTLGGEAVALSAIGNPEAFESAVAKLGYEVRPLRFPDHHMYAESDLEAIERLALRLHAPVITTEKDWVKLRSTRWAHRGNRPPLRVAEQKLRFFGDGEAAWKDVVAGALKGRRAA